MIRLLGPVHTTLRRLRRRRISNQLAAFAAIMLFASTQVPAPDAPDVEHGPQALALNEVTEDGEPDTNLDGLQQEEQPSPLAAPATTAADRRSRDLNLSLFLLRL